MESEYIILQLILDLHPLVKYTSVRVLESWVMELFGSRARSKMTFERVSYE